MYYALCKYKKFHPETYQGIVVTDEKKRVLKRFTSGDFDDDLKSCEEWAGKENIELQQSNTIENYRMDRYSDEAP